MTTFNRASRSRLARLNLDFSELLASPYPGVSVYWEESDITNFCLHLCPDSGAYEGLRLHFDVWLPVAWPSQPPQVKSSAEVDHPNVFGSFICCDLLKPAHGLPPGYSGGYTPALTLQGLFIQFLSFFASERVEQTVGEVTLGKAWEIREGETVPTRNPRWVTTAASSSEFLCSKCAYGYTISHLVGAQSPPDGPEVQVIRNGFDQPVMINTDNSAALPPYMYPPAKCQVQKLNSDTLYELLLILPTESLLSFCSAYQFAHDISRQFHILLQRELRCFFLRQTLMDCVLGIGVHLDHSTSMLSSEFDWLSEQAFDDFALRTSIRKRPFEFFLPLAFSGPHFARVESTIWSRLAKIDDEIQGMTSRKRQLGARRRRVHLYQSVRVIYQFMNNVIVSLMKSADANLDDPSRARGTSHTDLLLAERAVVAYCQLYHLLTSLARANPVILREATAKLWQFLKDPQYRSKANVPDMGELIVMASLVFGSTPVGHPITWTNHLDAPFLEEVFVRNVRWTLKDHPELGVMESGLSEYRLAKTFQSARTSLRLTMSQVAFLSTIVASHVASPSLLADSYGFLPRIKPTDKPIEEKMVEIIKKIYAVSSWPEFFDRVDFPGGRKWGKEVFSRVLRDCVSKSEAKGYHKKSTGMWLQDLRREKERAWVAEQARRTRQ